MKKIVVIATGGTIAGSGEAGKTADYRAGTIEVEEVLASIPQVKDIANIEMIQLLSVDSNEMNEQHWLALLDMINKQASRDDVDGIVVTHGTDTLEETAYFLNLTVHTVKPVVLTGAMRPATATSADGPFNLYQAIALAANDKAIGCGIMALFSSTIYSARGIEKVNNYKIDAFGHNGSGALGYMRDDEVYISTRPVTHHTIYSLFSHEHYQSLPNVSLVTYYAGAPVLLLEAVSTYSQGIVVVGTGSGNFSKQWVDKLEELARKGIVIVRSSRVAHAIVFDEPVFDPEHLFVGSNTLSPFKARILLALCLTRTKKREEIEQFFKTY
ncbi:asparaginase [Sharpea azabuensis]|uniref:asparaginase n=1 Tax=Sharpea porci TaxID=2652286 RepID=A0A844FRB1_9FIRM|nr:asparaginase [Sharpea porci]MST88000.1 asparaginase [Sharpea porci]